MIDASPLEAEVSTAVSQHLQARLAAKTCLDIANLTLTNINLK